MVKLVLGILLIVGALAGMVRVLGEQIPGYFEDTKRIEQETAEVDALLSKAKGGTDAEKATAARDSERMLSSIRRNKEFLGNRLQGIGIVGVGGSIGLVAGILLIRSWRRGRQASAAPAAP